MTYDSENDADVRMEWKYLIVMTMITDNVDSLDNIWMFESAANAEFGGDLFLILLLGLPSTFRSELLHSKNGATILGGALDKSDGAACS